MCKMLHVPAAAFKSPLRSPSCQAILTENALVLPDRIEVEGLGVSLEHPKESNKVSCCTGFIKLWV